MLAYWCHWPLADILQLQHGDRQRWVDEISAINNRLRAEAEEPQGWRRTDVG